MCSTTSRFLGSLCRGVASGLQLLRSVNCSGGHLTIERHRGFRTGEVIEAVKAFGAVKVIGEGKAIWAGKTTELGKKIRADEVVDSNGRQNRKLCVTLIEGLGSGPAMCAAVRKIFKAACVWVQWDRHTLRVHRNPYTDRLVVNADLVHSATETGLVLRGPVSDSTQSSAALTLHKMLDAFVSVRQFASVDGYQPFGRVRIVNIRDNVSGEYSEIEHTVVPGVVQSIKTVTRSHSHAVAKFAFDYAVEHGHRRVTALHMANVMRLSDGTFLRACRQVSLDYLDVEYREEKLDLFCLRVVNDPGLYDVLLTPSLYGAIANAACCSLVGGAAMVPLASYGPRAAVFSAMSDVTTGCEHYRYNAGPSGADHDVEILDHLVAGRYPVANPTGLIRSAVLMLNHVGMTDTGLCIDQALQNTIRQGVRTHDIGGNVSCAHFTDAIIRNMQNR